MNSGYSRGIQSFIVAGWEHGLNGQERIYRFGSFALEEKTALVYLSDELVPLPPKVAQTLLLLVKNHGHVVEKDFLLDAIWPDTNVEESNLHHNVSVLRKLLRSDSNAPASIETLPKRGYRFLAEVTISEKTNGQADLAPGAAGLASSPDATVPPATGARPAWRWLVAAAVGIVLCVSAAAFLVGVPPSAKSKSIPANSIAVLPFSNVSADSQADYLSDGLTDELINALTRVKGLRVVARTSTFQFRGKSVDPRRLGDQLQAHFLLEGGVQKQGDRLRVTAQLIDTTTGFDVWSEKFDRPFGDIFAIQDEICRAIAGVLSARISDPDGVRRGSGKTSGLEIYTLYLRGLKEWNRRNGAGVRAALEFFERAIALDDTYAPAWSGVAETLVHAGVWGILPPSDAFPRAKAAALRAVELDAELAEPYSALGYVQGWYERDQKAAEDSFRRSLYLNPGYSWGRENLASYLSVLGRHGEAIGEYRRTLELDPISPSANAGLALAYFWARQYDRAVEQCAKTREVDPQFPLTYYYLAHSLEQKKKYEDAIGALREGIRLWGSTDGMMLAQLQAASPGHRNEALEGLEKIKSRPESSTQPYLMALIYGALGDREKTFEWLEKAHGQRDVWFLYANVDPRLDGMRGDPRFQQLMKHQ